jgi:hypothetical protein
MLHLVWYDRRKEIKKSITPISGIFRLAGGPVVAERDLMEKDRREGERSVLRLLYAFGQRFWFSQLKPFGLDDIFQMGYPPEVFRM